MAQDANPFGTDLSAHDSDLDLWIRQPDPEAADVSVAAARLCSCSDVCLAVIEDNLD